MSFSVNFGDIDLWQPAQLFSNTALPVPGEEAPALAEAELAPLSADEPEEGLAGVELPELAESELILSEELDPLLDDEDAPGLDPGSVDEPDDADPGVEELLLVSFAEDPAEEDELGGEALLPAPARLAGVCSPHAASAAAMPATAHSFAILPSVWSILRS